MAKLIKPFPGSNETIEKVALKFRQRLDIESDCRIGATGRLVDCVKETGGKICVVDSPASYEAEGGSLVIRGPHRYTIYLSPYTTPLRDNFTIAHELGHFVLHYTPVRDDISEEELPLVFARYGTGLQEWQANRFAAALLMPKEPFEEDFNRLGGDIELLAGRYGVSVPAAEIRCKSLGLSASAERDS